MRQLLEAEGIVFSAEERVDMKRYGWDPTRDLTEEALKHILDEAYQHSRQSQRAPHISHAHRPRLATS